MKQQVQQAQNVAGVSKPSNQVPTH
ncbi:hypothetical protein ACVNPX_02220 [Staphylococcus aureus]